MLNLCRHPSCVLSVTGAAASASRSGSSKQLISALLGGGRGEEGPWGLGASGAWSGGGAAGSGGSEDGDGEEGERVGWNGAIEMTLTGDKQRESFVQEMLSTLAGTLKKAFCARGSGGERAKKTPPPPLPLAPLPERQEEREEPEDESLKKQEEHYLRELRICLREVLGELRKDRRFSMFKQIGDYEGEFMDLNGIRDKLNAEEYVTLDDFEEDLKLMAEEAKEVRDRLKANLASAEANASALEGARGAAAGEVGGGGAPGGAGRGSGGGDDMGLRRALLEVDRATNQLARAATAVDMACFLRDAALSFLQDCVSRLGYDLEGKCKDIAARKKARGNGGGGGRAGGRSSPTSGKRSATAAGGRGDGGGGSRSAVAPNYTSESVIEDIYGGVTAQQTGTGSRDRATRASRRSASSDGRFVQLGDRGKLLEQGTEVEVVPPPAKRAARQRSPAKRRVMFDKGDGEEGGEQEGHEKQAPPAAPAVTVSTAEEEGKLGEGEVRGQASSAQGATTSAPATVEPPLAASVLDSGSVSGGSCTNPGSNAAVVAAPAPAASKDATVAEALAAPAPTTVATTLPALETAHGSDEEQQNGGGQAVSSATNPAAPAEEEEEPRPALVVPSPEAAANGIAANVNLGAASIPSGAAPSVAADAAAGGAGLEQRRQEDPTQPVTAATEAFPLGVAADGDGDALMKDAQAAAAAAAAAAVDAGPPTQLSLTSGSTSLGGPAGGDGGCDGGVAIAPAAAATAAMTAAAAATVMVAVDPPAVLSSSSSSNGAPSAADKAQTEALAAEEVVKAATAAATRQQAESDRKRAKRACEQACARLLDTRASVSARTRGWSVEQLLALRGGALELGAALCGRGMPRAKAASALDAVDVVLRYMDRRLPR